MRRSSVFIYLSAVALVVAVATELLGWPEGRSWFLLAWAVFMLATVIALLAHPMRGPAWGLFVGFWGILATVVLIVLQALAAFGVLQGYAYGQWTAVPLAVIAIWVLVGSGAGFGAEPFGPLVDALGLLTGVGLLAISIGTWAGLPDVTRVAGLTAAVAYVLWAVFLGRVVWSLPALVRGSSVPTLAHGAR
jgi:hypothetical protein